MTLRKPIVLANQTWSESTTTKAAEIFSSGTITQKPARITIAVSGTINDGDTVTIGSNTYTFRTSPSTTGEVRIGSTNDETLQNLGNEIASIDADVKPWFETPELIVEDVTATGSSSTLVFSTTAALTITAVYGESPAGTARGSEGAQEYSGLAIDIEIDGTSNSLTLPAYTYTDDISQVATDISSGLTGATASVVGTRIKITHGSSGPFNTLFVVSGDPLFIEGDYSGGITANHPATDSASGSKYIRLIHPADPQFFRVVNRPLLDLYENDKLNYTNFIALIYGYDYDTGNDLLSSDKRLNFRAPAGYTFHTDVRFKGDIILEGSSIIRQVTSVLIVSDRTITINAGETGAGVGGTGIAGLYVDRGTAEDVSIIYDENETVSASGESGVWKFDGVGGVPTLIKSVRTVEDVTIGDGTNTFGTFNATNGNISTALANAIAHLPNGGRIFIKRGTYYILNDISINGNHNISIEGEGASTAVHTLSSRFHIGNTNDTYHTKFNSLRLTTLGNGDHRVEVTGWNGTSYALEEAVTDGSANTYTVKFWFQTGPTTGILGLSGASTPTGTLTGGTSGATSTTGTVSTVSTGDMCIEIGGTGIAFQTIITSCWFSGEQDRTVASGLSPLAKDIDITNSVEHMIYGNVSNTGITNLP